MQVAFHWYDAFRATKRWAVLTPLASSHTGAHPLCLCARASIQDHCPVGGPLGPPPLSPLPPPAPPSRYTQHNIHFEKACVMFNLAAVTSQQALTLDRTTPEGLLAASKLFQVNSSPWRQGHPCCCWPGCAAAPPCPNRHPGPPGTLGASLLLLL